MTFSKNHIDITTKSGFCLFYLWWGYDPLIDFQESKKVRVIEFHFGRPYMNIGFEFKLW